MNIYEDTKFIMQKYGVHPNKDLGQNFLVDQNALSLISDGVTANDIVIEIGPGLGTLTAILAENAKKVIAIEFDKKMFEILEDRFALYENVELINQDVLKFDFEKVINEYGIDNIKVVANLPYYITTQILTMLLETKIKDITILIQKEVAERITAKTGTKLAGAITYMIEYYADSKIVGDVPKECFIPSPKVDSSVVNLKRLENPRIEVKNEKLLFDLVKANFLKRRKTITNSLSSVIEKEKLVSILKELNIKEDVRGEALTLEDFAAIANLC